MFAGRAWLYLALNENSLESYLRLFQENLALLHKYYVKNALVCSHDHLTLFLTLVSGLEFIRFDLDLVRHHGSWWQRVGRSEVLLREPIVCD